MRRAALLLVLAAVTAAPPAAQAAFPQTAPDDPLYDASPLPNATNEQWDLASPSGGFDRGISAQSAWPLSVGAGITIADIDVGVQLDHPDLAGRWALNRGETGRDRRGRDRATNGADDDRNGYVDDWRGWDFFARDNNPTSDTANTHGTNVAGVLGAATDNGIGIAGIAPGARILAVRSADDILHQGVRLAEAIVYAADRRATVASMSLGTDSNPRAMYRAAAYAERKGMVLVAAMGNEFHFHHEFPATLDRAISVGAINPDTANTTALNGDLATVATDFKVRAAYSDYGPHIDVVAPTQVPTTQWGGGYIKNWSGTSAATPHVAGVVALVAARGRSLGLRLRPGEIRQIIRMTAQDIVDPTQGIAAGWDRFTGWGRVDAYEAVRRAARGRIPPDPELTAPSWYDPVAGRLTVRGRVRGRSPSRWTLELGAGEEPASWTRLSAGRRSRVLARVNARRLAPGGYTLRLRATDADRNVGEDRRFFFAIDDPTLKRGYPRSLRSSGESSPALADLDGDGAAEIVLATSDGIVRVLSGRTGRELRGWPRRMRAAPASRATARRIGTVRSGFLATPAVGDIAGGRAPEVVAAGLDGRVYAWTARGRRLAGFPRRIDATRPPPGGRLDAAIYASPALGDLNRDGKLDIVVGAADQRIYAWDGRGRRLRGWPVLARDSAQDGEFKILSSPAIGDVDGDGSPDVVEGTAEGYGSPPSTTGRVYAFSARGRLLPGWPVKPHAVAANSIPLAGQGVPGSIALADVDGNGSDEIAAAAFTGEPQLFRGDGSTVPGPGSSEDHFESSGRGAASPASSPSALALGSSGSFGRLSPGGPLRFFSGMVDSRLAAAQASPARPVAFEHLLGGWDAGSGKWLAAFPRPVEGWQIATAPVIADVDGDGRAEVLEGTSGYLLHAYRADGSEPRGWPKQTGGWLLASPAVADVDGDGRLEVAAVTREGHLFVWDTPARASSMVEWGSFRHDASNTGRYATAPRSVRGRRPAADRRSGAPRCRTGASRDRSVRRARCRRPRSGVRGATWAEGRPQ